MIRTSCPKCGREDAVAPYLASLPLMCKGCGSRVTVGEAVPDKPLFPPPPAVASPPPPPPVPAWAVPPPPKPLPPPPPPVVEEPAVVPLVTEPEEEPLFLHPPEQEPVALAPAPPPEPPEWAKPTAKPAPPPELPFPLPLASVGRRLYARFLFLVGLALMGGLGMAFTMFSPALKRDWWMQAAVVAAVPAIYLLVNALMLARTGQDVGKRYAGVRIVKADGSPATPAAALLKRDALTLLLGLTGVGLIYWLLDLVTLFTRRGHCLHDKVAGTRVVRV